VASIRRSDIGAKVKQHTAKAQRAPDNAKNRGPGKSTMLCGPLRSLRLCGEHVLLQQSYHGETCDWVGSHLATLAGHIAEFGLSPGNSRDHCCSGFPLRPPG
jgi:hypothetical protein